MRKLILAAVFGLGTTSASLAGSGGGEGYDGMVVVNVYEYLAAHGCPDAGFSLLNCRYDRPQPVPRHKREARRSSR